MVDPEGGRRRETSGVSPRSNGRARRPRPRLGLGLGVVQVSKPVHRAPVVPPGAPCRCRATRGGSSRPGNLEQDWGWLSTPMVPRTDRAKLRAGDGAGDSVAAGPVAVRTRPGAGPEREAHAPVLQPMPRPGGRGGCRTRWRGTSDTASARRPRTQVRGAARAARAWGVMWPATALRRRSARAWVSAGRRHRRARGDIGPVGPAARVDSTRRWDRRDLRVPGAPPFGDGRPQQVR